MTPPSTHLVALLGLPELGPRRLAMLLDHHGEPGRAWEAVRSGSSKAVALPVSAERRAELARVWSTAARRVDPDVVGDAHREAGVTILTPDDERWPLALRTDPEPPPLLFCLGDPAALAGRTVAIVGTRRCTAAGKATSRELGAGVAAAGVAVVSGLAIGIDGAAHEGALRAAGRTIGVVATGLDVVYPRRHRELWSRVAASGVLLSEAPLGTTAERWRFPARNRLIAALGEALIVVESRTTGGSMLTVDAAIERQRDVLAVPGSVHSAASSGPNQLIFDGCAMVRSSADVLGALGLTAPPTSATGAAGGLPVPDDPAHPVDDPVAVAVGPDPVPLDALATATGLALPALLTRLATLELAGTVERVGDGYRRRLD